MEYDYLGNLKAKNDMKVGGNSEHSPKRIMSNRSFQVKPSVSLDLSSVGGDTPVSGEQSPMSTYSPEKQKHNISRNFSRRYRRSRSRGSNRSSRGGTRGSTREGTPKAVHRVFRVDSQKVFDPTTRNASYIMNHQLGTQISRPVEQQNVIIRRSNTINIEGSNTINTERGRARTREVPEQYGLFRSNPPSPRHTPPRQAPASATTSSILTKTNLAPKTFQFYRFLK